MAHDLEARMQQNNAPAQQRPATMADQIKQMQGQFAMAAPKGMEAQQLVRDALTVLRQNPQLAQCTPQTVLGGLMSCAQLGLRPGVLGQAYLIPFKNKGTMEAQLVIGYAGLVDLAHRSGQIKSLIARTVYANDFFEVDYGIADTLVHKPYMGGDKGDPVAYYAIAKFNSGGHAFITMSHAEMVSYKNKNSKTSKWGPWVDHFESMAHKTCVRQLSKWMPKSTDMATAIAADESVRVDLTPAAIDYPEHPEHVDGEVVPEERAA